MRIPSGAARDTVARQWARYRWPVLLRGESEREAGSGLEDPGSSGRAKAGSATQDVGDVVRVDGEQRDNMTVRQSSLRPSTVPESRHRARHERKEYE
jgi:hypothetical protein